MFKSIRNNFGAPEITFNDVQTGRYVVLNARFTFDPANAAYRAARELEITVPGMSLDRSADMPVFAVYEDSMKYDWSDETFRYHFATVLRSRIRDRNTVSIEKITDFDAFAPVHIYIYTMYSALNTGELTVLSDRTALEVSADPPLPSGNISRICVVDRDWVLLTMVFPSSLGQVDGDMKIALGGFPEDAVCDEFPILGISNQLHPQTGGSVLRQHSRRYREDSAGHTQLRIRIFGHPLHAAGAGTHTGGGEPAEAGAANNIK